MQKELKSCPFCGSDDVFLKYNGAKHGLFYYVECAVCGGRTRGACRPWKDVPDGTDKHEWDCAAAEIVTLLWERRSGHG